MTKPIDMMPIIDEFMEKLGERPNTLYEVWNFLDGTLVATFETLEEVKTYIEAQYREKDHPVRYIVNYPSPKGGVH